MIFEKKDYDIINLYTNNKKIADDLSEEIIFKNDSHLNEYGNLLVYQLLKENILGKKYTKEFKFQNDIERKINNLYR